MDFKINLGETQHSSDHNDQTAPTVGANFNQQGSDGKEPIDFTNFLQHANHPAICFFTIIFKISAILTYLIDYFLDSWFFPCSFLMMH